MYMTVGVAVLSSIRGHVMFLSFGLLQFLKRQDLLNVLARMMRPVGDQVVRIGLWSL